uniref:Alternative protein FANCA n=1 Tax=Homo sapiens TaxID=9606 RepID=L8E9D3_HUMAN|nr:alternative protein FANCA [Homo sapiens]
MQTGSRPPLGAHEATMAAARRPWSSCLRSCQNSCLLSLPGTCRCTFSTHPWFPASTAPSSQTTSHWPRHGWPTSRFL